jgi:dTDP-4-dehydrorhamnose 3,5-epimerase
VTIHDAPLSGVQIIDLDVYTDDRGDFRELWNAERYREHGLDVSFVQDNLSRSSEGVLRGLHFQNPHPQGKLITVLRGEVYDVVVDVRPGSDTFSEWYGTTLSADDGRQLYVPEGFAHGFVVTRGPALFHYKCTDVYVPNADRSIRWNDPALAIDWPVRDPILSDKDADAPVLEDLPAEALEFTAPAE